MKRPDEFEWYVCIAVALLIVVLLSGALADWVERWVARQTPNVTEVRR